MYKKQESSQLKKEFWTSFGQYMAPVASAEGEKINWINYKTGIREIFFRMDAGKDFASISIELSHVDTEQQKKVFDLLRLFSEQLEDIVGEKWNWQLYKKDEHEKIHSVISATMHGVNIYDRNTWPSIISFLKPRIIALDLFWYNTKDFIENQ